MEYLPAFCLGSSRASFPMVKVQYIYRENPRARGQITIKEISCCIAGIVRSKFVKNNIVEVG